MNDLIYFTGNINKSDSTNLMAYWLALLVVVD
jgi:hypothetical protein